MRTIKLSDNDCNIISISSSQDTKINENILKSRTIDIIYPPISQAEVERSMAQPTINEDEQELIVFDEDAKNDLEIPVTRVIDPNIEVISIDNNENEDIIEIVDSNNEDTIIINDEPEAVFTISDSSNSDVVISNIRHRNTNRKRYEEDLDYEPTQDISSKLKKIKRQKKTRDPWLKFSDLNCNFIIEKIISAKKVEDKNLIKFVISVKNVITNLRYRIQVLNNTLKVHAPRLLYDYLKTRMKKKKS